jgi:hypothetical protein
MGHGRGLRITASHWNEGQSTVRSCQHEFARRVLFLSADSQGTEDKARAMPFRGFQSRVRGGLRHCHGNQLLVNSCLNDGLF